MTYLNKIILSAFAPFLIVAPVAAQSSYESEALTYSQYEYRGSARMAGVAGAFTSVGAEHGAIPLNPASVALFRGSEVSTTLTLGSVSSKSDYIGFTNKDSRFRALWDNLSIVIAGGNKRSNIETKTLRGFGLSFGMNRLADYNSASYFAGHNDTNSITDQYVAVFNDPRYKTLPIDYTNFPMDYVLASQSGLVNYDPVRNYTNTPVTVPVHQSGSIRTSGGLHDLSMSFGANLIDKVYIGASIGFPFMNYKREYVYTESDDKNLNPVFNSLKYTQNYSVMGIGFNGKLGVIVRPIRLLRIGASITTPTYFSLKEQYSASMENKLDTITITKESPVGAYDFSYRQPFRFNVGASVFFDKYGFFSLDYELVNYKKNHFDFGVQNKEVANQVNSLVEGKYRVGHSIRAGVELAYKVWRLRGGFAYQFSPFQKGVAVSGYDQSKMIGTCGAGYKGNRFSVDIAYVRVMTKSYYAPYYSLFTYGEDGARISSAKDLVMLTVGFRFSK